MLDKCYIELPAFILEARAFLFGSEEAVSTFVSFAVLGCCCRIFCEGTSLICDFGRFAAVEDPPGMIVPFCRLDFAFGSIECLGSCKTAAEAAELGEEEALPPS